MTKLARWQPITEVEQWFDRVDRLFDRLIDRFFRDFDRAFRGMDLRWERWIPAMDVSEKEDAYLIRLEVPGVKPEDIEVTLHGGVLTIKGKRDRTDEQKGETYHWQERIYGEFVRSLRLPEDVKEEAVEAHYRDGVLELRLPKAEESKPRRIAVKGA